VEPSQQGSDDCEKNDAADADHDLSKKTTGYRLQEREGRKRKQNAQAVDLE
jgi:hypothetical protein